MGRRRLRLSSSSEDEAPPPSVTTETLILNSNPNRNPNSSSSHIPYEISDDEDDFVDVPENFSPPPPVPVPDSPIDAYLRNLGLNLRREWLDSCIVALSNYVPGFTSIDVAGKAKLCFDKFLVSDMNYSGAGVLPGNVHDLHLADLAGPFVLQVDEITNISNPLKGRYQNASAGIKRCLKLSMTDGVQRVFGMEYRPIKDIEVLSPAGLKVHAIIPISIISNILLFVVINNVEIRHGLLMLVPEVLDVFGGVVEDLEAAHQRLVHEVNKPPRGKRTRTGTLPSLASRATCAAWLPNNDNHGHANNSTAHGAKPFPLSNQGGSLGASAADTRYEIAQEFDIPNRRLSFNSTQTPNASVSVEEIRMIDTTVAMSRVGVRDRIVEEFAGPSGRPTTEPNSSLNTVLEVRESNMVYEVGHQFMHSANEEISFTCTRERIVEEFASSRSPNSEPNSSSIVAQVIQEVDMVDELENQHLRAGTEEIPFTYMSSLQLRWTDMKDDMPFVQGKIKVFLFVIISFIVFPWCFLTGVKGNGFQFKGRTKFELHVYIDDGSLISEVLIDHNIVQKRIGYSPNEVTSALSSTDKSVVSKMKETMKQYQSINIFQGTMLIEYNHTVDHPVALEMEQGCSTSDAWLLLERMKMSAPQTPQHHHPEAVYISP
ncbi:hypothetical protein GIB67_009412 [Kingdonia uniflora]|uniref:RecQ-mediated genome instability protein 1 n=1 Tax=Kingdonia uniflora TaxID=39325 RepID=A0A7J7N327_9MAGN|nr:hypothetical protein GIB67_009412 [Kingdonia uniflora]